MWAYAYVNMTQKRSIEENNRIETAEKLIQKRQVNSCMLRALFWEQRTQDHTSHLLWMGHHKRPPKSGVRGFYLYMANTFYKATLARLTEQKMRNNFFKKLTLPQCQLVFLNPCGICSLLLFTAESPWRKRRRLKTVQWPGQSKRERALWGEEMFKQS